MAQCTGKRSASGEMNPPGPPSSRVGAARPSARGGWLSRNAGNAALADAAAGALAHAPAWPEATPSPRSMAAAADDSRTVVYDASGEVPPGAARVVVTARTATAEQAVGAPGLGDPHGPLASRLAALDAPCPRAFRHRYVSHRRRVRRGNARRRRPRPRVRRGVAHRHRRRTARQELAVEVADTMAPPDLGRELAARAAESSRGGRARGLVDPRRTPSGRRGGSSLGARRRGRRHP